MFSLNKAGHQPCASTCSIPCGRAQRSNPVCVQGHRIDHHRLSRPSRARCIVVRNTSVVSGIQPITKRAFHDANFPVDDEGRTYHLGTKRGEVANRILSVGSNERAILISHYLEPPAPGKPIFKMVSSRGFLTVTGKYKGVPVSIVSTMMGMPNMDFVVRENRAVVDGEMAIIRLGTCGAVRPPAKLGCLLLASKGSICVRRDVDAFTRMYETIEASHRHSHGHNQGHGQDHLHAGSEHAATLRQHLYGNGAHRSNGNGNGKQHSNGHANGTAAHHSNGKQHSNGSSNGSHASGSQVNHYGLPQVPYLMSLPVSADQELAQLLSKAAAEQVGRSRVIHGLNATADSFYASQGRLGGDFEDHNEQLVPALLARHPDLISLEMETFQLLDLARSSHGSLRAMGFCIALAERYSNTFMEPQALRDLERQGGVAALQALVACKLRQDVSTGAAAARPDVEYIWA